MVTNQSALNSVSSEHGSQIWKVPAKLAETIQQQTEQPPTKYLVQICFLIVYLVQRSHLFSQNLQFSFKFIPTASEQDNMQQHVLNIENPFLFP